MKTSKLTAALVAASVVMIASSALANGPGVPQVSAPEAGSTAALMTVAFAGLAAIKRFMR